MRPDERVGLREESQKAGEFVGGGNESVSAFSFVSFSSRAAATWVHTLEIGWSCLLRTWPVVRTRGSVVWFHSRISGSNGSYVRSARQPVAPCRMQNRHRAVDH